MKDSRSHTAKRNKNATGTIKEPRSRAFKKRLLGKKSFQTGWFWVVGFGGSLRGRRESAQKLMVLQTFPPNPFSFGFFFPSVTLPIAP
jgi:hypothetical protein